ncbi:Protein of unknown function [Blastococcus aggregatus]|uniref:Restriction endonuclease type II-like domain-containing protein n=1 Tax=Blastococcus aggregatus TaxID=38502 RepID=A0A285VGD4_9ACTN|nr:DUF559 domain-containing protein [Blastococcus aggregatus]SOC52628.1 Protein of unknown function [Blastococcus aggregatus]
MPRPVDLLPHGVARRADVTAVTSTSTVGRWLAQGRLLVVAPGVVALPDRTVRWADRARAATLYADAPLSHLSALTAAGLVRPTAGPLHVTVELARCLRDASDVLVHRSGRRLTTIRCDGLEVIEPARSLVDAWWWAWSPTRNRRAPAERPLVRQAVIEAVRTRAVRASAVRRQSDRTPRHAGRVELVALLELVERGCQSELEIFGVQHVLPGPPTVPAFVQQHRVVLPDGRAAELDAAWPEAGVAVELDGAAFHGSREARERDLRRDNALATLGWVVLRFSYERLVSDPAGCRREIEAVVRRRLADR